MTNKLYIIGNGFDLHHGLRTSYANFRDDFLKKNNTLWKILIDVYGEALLQDDLWWCDFENMLGRVNYENLAMSRNGEGLGAVKIRNLMRGTLPPLFGKWVEGVEAQTSLDVINSTIELEKNSLYFTFNYTLLLEKLYQIADDNIWHIHKSIKHVDDIIVGHDADGGQLIQYFQEYNRSGLRVSPSFADMINQEVMKGAKMVNNRIFLNEKLFYQYSNINHFVAMGFSFNNIDMPYIKKIVDVNKNIEKADWTLFWHGDGEEKQMKRRLMDIGINQNKIKAIRW